MYYRKKNKVGLLAVAVIAISCVILLAIVMWPDNVTKDGIVGSDNKVRNATDYTDEENKEEKQYESTNNVINDKQSSYYLLKSNNGIVNLYFCDGDGEETILEETDILIETLNEEDQKVFLEGLKVEDRDQLFKVLQDYES